MRYQTATGLVVLEAPRLWTPAQGVSGLVVVAQQSRPLLAVTSGGNIVSQVSSGSAGFQGRVRSVTLGGLGSLSSTRQKEPTRVIGHPDLASGASVQRGETLYVSVAEAVYRESRGENVEIHLTPTDDDVSALADLRVRARQRWENDRLPDGWTRPLPPPPSEEDKPDGKLALGEDDLPDDLRRLAEQIRAREELRNREKD